MWRKSAIPATESNMRFRLGSTMSKLGIHHGDIFSRQFFMQYSDHWVIEYIWGWNAQFDSPISEHQKVYFYDHLWQWMFRTTIIACRCPTSIKFISQIIKGFKLLGRCVMNSSWISLCVFKWQCSKNWYKTLFLFHWYKKHEEFNFIVTRHENSYSILLKIRRKIKR